MNKTYRAQVAMPFNINTPIIAAAILVGMALIFRALAKRGLAARQILLFILLAWVSGLFVGKALFLVNDWISFGAGYPGFPQWFACTSHGDALYFALYGYASVGGIAGAIFGTWLFSKWSKRSFTVILDDCALPVLLMYGIVRVGCALYGCCYGIELAEPGSPLLSAVCAHAGDRWLFPVQWLDCIVTMAVCLYIYLRSRTARYPVPRLRLALLIFPLQRFLLEFLRGDAGRGMIWIFSTTQILFLLIWITGIVLFRYLYKKNCSMFQEQ